MDKLLKKSSSREFKKGEAKEAKKIYPLTEADYEVLEEVGHGVSATVYRALCIPFKEVVAIKSLDLERWNSNLDDIRREAQIMQLILHPNLVSAHCSFMADQSLKIVMPCLAGRSCLNVMKVRYPDGFEEPIIATVLKETLKALDYLHKQGHIHRDVKAGNILLDEHGRVKLGDFGVSAGMFDTGERQRSRNTFVGTPCWMAPEVMEQIHGYDFKADIWSFGITALELAHGRAPFSQYPSLKVFLMTLQNAPPTLNYERDKRFSKCFKEMIAMCLEKNLAQRPTAEKLLKHPFFKNTRSSEYIAKHLLEGLPPLGQRAKILKLRDAAMLAQMKMPYEGKEEQTQNEYKHGVSCWNFDIEDHLAVETPLLPEEKYAPISSRLDKHELSNCSVVHQFCSAAAADKAAVHSKNDHPEGPAEPTHSLQDEITNQDSKQLCVASSSVSKPTKEFITARASAGISDQPQRDNKGQVQKDERELEKEGEEKTDHSLGNHWGCRMHFRNVATPDLGGLRIRDLEKDLVDACGSDKFYLDRKSAASSGALADRGPLDISAINDIPLMRRSSSEVTVNKVKEPIVPKKNRFTIISEVDVELPKPLAQSSTSPPLTPTSMERPQLGNIVQTNAVHHNGVSHDLTSHIRATDYGFGFQRYRVQYVTDLQNRISDLDDELMKVKLKNMQLEQ